MYPNTNFLKFFPAEELPETKGSAYRSGCLSAGTYFVLRKIIAEYGRELRDVINEEIRLCGYFVIITSEKMTAAQALELYKSRDTSEKLFRGDKSYLGNKSFRVQTSESVQAKIFIEFVALIIRSRFYTCLKEQMQKSGKKNYMTVPAAIRELEKIELIRQSDRGYRMDYAVTITQKEILKAFNMTAANIKTQAVAMNKDLMQIEKEG